MFGGLNKKTVLQVLVIFLVLKVLSEGTSGILILLFTLPGVLLAITFHEWAHAFVAVKLGDETPKEQGTVTLNPIKHIDPFGFIFLILAGFGWGKPVEIDSRNFNGKYSISKAEAIVAIAGPIANFILAFILLLIVGILHATGALNGLTANMYGAIYMILTYAISINVGLGVFNLIPLPPLDGSKVLTHFLPYKAKQWFYDNQTIFYLVFMLIWLTGLSSKLLQPLFTGVINGLSWIAELILGLFIK